MSAIINRVNKAAKEFLVANRPGDVPEEVLLRKAQDTEKVKRPFAVVRCEDGEGPHPKMQRVTFILELKTHADDSDTNPDEEIHQLLVEVFAMELADFYARLLAVGLKMVKFNPSGFTDESDGDRDRIYGQRWTLWMELVEPESASSAG